MIAVIERELVERKKWLEHDEFLDMVAIAESTPGPIAINSATYVGYKIGGVLGSIFATLGIVLPSFTIVFIISLFFDKFLEFTWVQYAFRGIQAGVSYLILSAGIKMFKSLKKTPFNLLACMLTVVCLLTLSLLAVSFSSIFYILIGGAIGLSIYLVGYIKNKKSVKKTLSPKDDKKGDNE